MGLNTVHDAPNLMKSLREVRLFVEHPFEQEVVSVCNQVLLQPLHPCLTPLEVGM